MAAKSFAQTLLDVLPPWWGRVFGAPVVRGLMGPFDVMAQDTADSVAIKFPTEGGDPTALAYTGKERRILRGPNEDDETYATRLRRWLDDHATRGGPYALAAQLWLYWRSALNVPFEIIYYSGRRYSVDTSGNVTRDDIGWNDPNGSGYVAEQHTEDPDDVADWAEFWIVFHCNGLSSSWTDDLGNVVVTDGGEEFIFDVLSGGALTPEDKANFASVPREWSAAHVRRIHVVLLYGTNRLWGYPVPVKKWGSDWGVWQADDPGRVTIEDN